MHITCPNCGADCVTGSVPTPVSEVEAGHGRIRVGPNSADWIGYDRALADVGKKAADVAELRRMMELK